jgi:ribonuclease Z
MQLVMLGTGEALVTKCFNTCFAFRNGGEHFLVDAGGGNGILPRLEKAGIPYSSIKEMFVTHSHTDHVLGAIWVIRMFAEEMQEGRYPGGFIVRCHGELVNVLNTICGLLLAPRHRKLIEQGVSIREAGNGETIDIIGMRLEFFDIYSRKARQFGFSAILPGGKKLVCLGDEPFNEINAKYVEGADWLLSEAMCLDSEKDIYNPYEKFHSTALDAARLAERMRVKNLLLYHTVDNDLAKRRELYTREAKSVFGGNVVVPDDGDIIDL